MFAEPIGPITITGVPGSPFTLHCVSRAGLSSVYQTKDKILKLTISHQTTSKNRTIHKVRWDVRHVSADPLVAPDDWDSTTIHTSIDRPGVGFSETEIVNIAAATLGNNGWLTGATVSKLYGEES